MGKKRKRVPTGIGLDAYGGPLIDPTQNVKDLTEAANLRQDDLRQLNNRYLKALIQTVEQTAKLKAKHVKNIADLHQIHDYAIHKAEAGRLDALRQNDREDVKALAAATTAKAEALQAQVSITAKTLADSFASAMAEQNKRLSAIELSQSEGRGKATVESPMMAEFIAKVDRLMAENAMGAGRQNYYADPLLKQLADGQEKLFAAMNASQGTKQGMLTSRDWIVAFIGLVLTLLTIYSLMRPALR